MQTANQSTPAVTAKNIQLANPAFNFHHLDSPSFNYSRTQPLPYQQYQIPANPSNYPDHTEPDCLLQRNGYSIHLVNSLKQRIKASTLIKQMYASRGYDTENISFFTHDPNQFTFLVSVGEIAAGTVTLQIDSDRGLLADELYHQEISHFREKGRKVCELSKFALDPQYSSKEMIASLFQVAYICAHSVYRSTDFFCEVNPRHAGPQKHMFGFQQIGEEKICSRVNAPAVLLHLDTKYIETQVVNVRKKTDRKTRILYPYFFPLCKEKEIVRLIQEKQARFTSPPLYKDKAHFHHHPKYFQPI